MTRLEPGLEFLPHVTLLRPLGRGGMGEVWVARDATRGEDVVVKVLPANAPPERVALLRREARLVRKLDHPGIVPVYAFEQGPLGNAVLVRYMKGGDAGRLRGAPPLRIVRLAREVAEALGHLHRLGVVHRDVKPTNVLLDEDGRAHLADFGIAAVAAPVDEEGLVLHGGGSRASMSPQQRAGEAATPADDVYALGALLYELVSGRAPFSANATDEEVRTEPPPPLEAPHPTPTHLRSLVASMLAKDPRDRPRDVRAVEEELRAVERELGGTPAPVSRPAGVRLEPPPPVAGAAAVTPAAGPSASGVRLQPPPRVPDIGVSAPVGPARPPAPRPEPSRSRTAAQIALLGSLALAVAFVVLVLPRFAKAPPPPAASTPEAASPEPATAPPAEAGPSGAASPPEALPESERDVPPAPPPREAPASAGERAEEATPNPPAPRTRAAPAPDAGDQDAERRAEEFRNAMSEAQAAFARGDWPAARQALARAAALEPGSPAVADARRRVEEGERSQALAEQREAARAYEAKEDWRRALAEYEAALKLDPAVAFAQEGRERTAARASLAERLDYHIAHPLRLATDAVAAEAERLLQEAREIDSPGPRHRRQIAALEQALARSRAAVPVVLESDGKTDVVVHKVGHLGRFARKVLELRPGTYTVVGTRSGFRDVRHQLVVEPDGPPPPLVVRCEEEI
jgi:tetratricopeptide (TPR) repeat protein